MMFKGKCQTPVEVVKEAEDGSGDIILRAYEAAGRNTSAECKIPSLGREFRLSFAPFEIKTVRLSEGKEVVCNNMLEENCDKEDIRSGIS